MPSKKYITTRIALEAFEYDPHGYKPDWFLSMVKTGKAYIYGDCKYQPACVKFGVYTAYIGDHIYIDETGYIGVYSASRFNKCCKPIDMDRDAATAFIDRLNDAVFSLNESLKK